MQTLQLTDGTVCRVEPYALTILAADYGVTKGRVKTAGDHTYIVVSPRKGSATREEVHLIDLLATLCYELPRLDTGEKWTCGDNDPRNLTRSNVVVQSPARCADDDDPEPESEPVVLLNGPAIDHQFDLLNVAVTGTKEYKPLLSLAKSILRNTALAEEVLSECLLSVCEQIRAGKFRGKTDGEFFAWVRAIVRRQCSQRLEGIVLNVCGDIEPDRAKIALKKKWTESGLLQELTAELADE